MDLMQRSVPALLLTLLLGTTGCAAGVAAGAAAGAAGAIAYSERGATTQLDASVEEIAAAAESVFAEVGVVVTGRAMENQGREVRITGSQDELEVTVEIQRAEDGLTDVEVIAKESVVDYDPDYAHDILERILARI